jgi:cell wall-associated NlpC family hydrolase
MRNRLLWSSVALLLVHAAPASADEMFPPGALVDPGSAAQFAESTLTLADVDTLSGLVLADGGAVSPAGLQTVSDLESLDALAFDASAAAEQARQDAVARKKAEEDRIAAEARARTSRAQTEVGPDGCPTAVPPRTLRNGAEEIGAHILCVSSVAAAPTGAAATAIKFTFQHLGSPYTRSDRMDDGLFDCSSYVMRAYAEAGVPTLVDGWAPSTHSIAPYPGHNSYPWLTTVSYDEALPGDLLLKPPSPNREDGGGHVAMLLADGFMIHTAATGDVSHVTTTYRESELFNIRRVVP